MRLSRTIIYAIQAVLCLAQAPLGKAVPCRQLARAGQMPERFLLHVLRALVKQGVLCSARGVDGGYTLARPPNQITLRDVIDAFENPFAPSLPVLEGQSAPVRERVLNTLQLISTAAEAELKKVSVAELIGCNGDQ